MNDENNENEMPAADGETGDNGHSQESADSKPALGAAEAAAAALAEENADLKDRLLRAVAEMDNLRKRTAREIKDAGQYAMTGFARDMLVVSDNLARALETVDQQKDAEGAAAMDAVRDGIRMTQSEFVRLMERHGVKEVPAAGERFDPNLHQAMFEVPDASIPNKTVTQVVQAGFMIGDRVLRPAMVGVSKGGPKHAAAQQAGEAAANENVAPNASPEQESGETGADHIDKTV